jgi:type 1 glutamine amidotransferase
MCAMKKTIAAVFLLGFFQQQPAPQQPAGITVDPTTPKKHVLVLAFTNGFYHGSTTDAAATIWQLGRESGLFDVDIRTDTKWITKGNAGPGESRNLNWYDAIFAVNTTGVWPLDEQQKKDFISFIHDDGKGFVAAHAALDANHGGVWPEFTDMLGGEFWMHPWYVFAAPVVVEDPAFPATRHFTSPHLTLYDEMYVPRMETFSRDKVNVLLRMDESRLPPPGLQEPYKSQALVSAQAAGALKAGDQAGFMPGTAPPGAAGGRGGGRGGNAPGVQGENGIPGMRPDHDFAIAWAKSYGKGRVFYSSLGHTRAAWQDPDVRKMYLEAIKWALRYTDGATETHPKRNP